MLSGASATRFAYDGAHAVAEYDGSSPTLTHRYIFGPGADELLLRYEGTSFCS